MSVTSHPRLRDHSFRNGVLTGAAAVIVATLVLAFFFPPTIYSPPEVAIDIDEAPDTLQSPNTAPDQATEGLFGVAEPDPIAPLGAPTGQASAGSVYRPPAPDVFQGGAAGSPSLVPPSFP